MFACIYIPNASADASAALLRCAGAFSPRVENTSAGTVVFDADGLERQFGSYFDIGAKVADEARVRHGLHPNVGIAANPGAAVCAARGFSGITVVARGTEAARLRDLPISVLQAPLEISEVFQRWGIRTVGAFADLPPAEVSARLGQEGVRLHNPARGAGIRPIVPYADTLRFVEVTDLDYEIKTIEPLSFILSRMLDRLCSRLASRNFATHEVRLSLGTYKRVLNLPVPIRNPKLLMKLLILDLEARPPGIPVRRIEVEAIPAKPRVVQNGLFVPLSPEPEKLELTLARLRAVVGEQNVGAAEILDTHRPDAVHLKKFRHSQPGGKNHLRVSKPRGVSLSCRLFRPPPDATVQLRNQSPCWIAFHGVHGSIVAATGPWRTSGDWWRPDMWDREEWDIEVNDALYRIYYDVHLDRWYVHGVYD